MTNFYADEDFPGPVIVVLRALRYDVLTVQEDGRAGGDDPDVLARAKELSRAVLTKNRDDFHHLRAQDSNHCGIVTISDDPDRPALAARIHAAVIAREPLAGLLVRIVKPNPARAVASKSSD